MGQQATGRKAQLEDAFRVFNLMSSQLAGSYRELEHHVARLHEELACARDERLRQLAEKETLANRLTHLLQALPGGVVVLDGHGIVVDCNPAAIELLGEPLRDTAWREVTERAFVPCAGDGGELHLRDGRRVSISIRSLGDEPGQIVLLTDVTETRALQEVLSRNKRLSAMGEMAAGIAHQIRTPLSAALLYASHLKRADLNAQDRTRVADRVLARLHHLENMVSDMLAFARGGVAADERFTVADLIESLLTAAEPLLHAGGAMLEVQDEARDALIEGSRDALLSALLNLVSNALQACGEGARLELHAVRASDGQVEIALRDDGPGIAPELRERIFEPFFTTRTDGTGLGLPVVRAIAHAHHGEAWVESESGSGSVFGLRLPPAPPAALASGRAFAERRAQARGAAPHAPLKRRAC